MTHNIKKKKTYKDIGYNLDCSQSPFFPWDRGGGRRGLYM